MTSWSIDWSFFLLSFKLRLEQKTSLRSDFFVVLMLISISRLLPCQGLSPHFNCQLRSYLKIKKSTAWHPKTWFKKLVSSWDILGCHEVPGLRHLIWPFVDFCLLLNVIWKQQRTNLTVKNFVFGGTVEFEFSFLFLTGAGRGLLRGLEIDHYFT